MIAIMGLRSYFNTEKQKEDMTTKFFDKNWRADSVQDLLRGLPELLAKIPEEERYNLFYTVANTHGIVPRDFHYQTIIAIDVDKCPEPKKAAEVICNDLGLATALTGLVASGNGLHILIALEEQIESQTYFNETRPYYKALCKRVNKALQDAGLEGVADPAIWDARRLLRLPGTENRKKDKDTKQCVLINGTIEAQGFDLKKAIGLPEVASHDQIAPDTLKTFAKPDTETILKECAFIQSCKDKPGSVSEAQWYALLSILPHLEDGRVLAHDFSREHPGYTVEETDDKIEQALASSGPRTCKNISYMYDGCRKCKYFQGEGIKSPIVIQGPNYIKTKDTGFYQVRKTLKGEEKKYPCYEDLFKYLQKESPTLINTSGVMWRYNGEFWVEYSKAEINNFAERNFRPSPNVNMRNEFLSKVKSNNIKDVEWFMTSTKGFVNFQNGVLNLKTLRLREHSKKYGFRGILPFEYNTQAACPRFKQFLDEITDNDEETALCIKEFIGYVLSGEPIWLHKAMVLHGSGANGKSTLIRLIQYLVGIEHASNLSLTSLNDAQSRFRLEGKTVNLADETNIQALAKSEVFKTVVAGGNILIKKLYCQPYEIPNTAKFVLSCNEMPETQDTSEGLFRRLMIIPLHSVFTEGGNVDPLIHEKLEKEAPGIFNECLQAYEGVKERRTFTLSARSREEKEQYIEDSDPFILWAEERTVKEQGDVFTTTRLLHGDFFRYCQNMGIRNPQALPKFSRRLSKHMGTKSKTKKFGRSVKRGYEGIKLALEDM